MNLTRTYKDSNSKIEGICPFLLTKISQISILMHVLKDWLLASLVAGLYVMRGEIM